MQTSNERQPQLLEEDARTKAYIHSFFLLHNLFSTILPFFLKRTQPSPYLTSICNCIVMRFTNLGGVLHMYSCLIDSVGLIDSEI
jgi:hypothetical protein